MPEPFGSDAFGRVRRESSDEVLRDLHDEVADHLASTAEELTRDSTSPEEARAAAQNRFGDVEPIIRRCWWIRKGEEVMTRVLGITLLTLVLAGVATLAFGGWHFQRSMSSRIDSLSEQLGTLAKTQEQMLAQQSQNLPVQIAGRAYLGDPSRPANGTFIHIYTAPPQKVPNQPYEFRGIRTVQTDEDGTFRSGPLEPGSYCLLAPYLNSDGKRVTDHMVQTELFHVYQSGQEKEVDLNLLPGSLLTIDLAEPFPNHMNTPEGEEKIVFLVQGSGPGPVLPFAPAAPLVRDWKWPLSGRSGNGLLLPTGIDPSDFPVKLPIPPGKHSLRISLDRWRPNHQYNLLNPRGTSQGVWIEFPDEGEVNVTVRIPDGAKEKLLTVASAGGGFEQTEPIQLEVTPPERLISDPYAPPGW